MGVRIAWKQVAERLAEEAAFQQQGASASREDLREAEAEFMHEAIKWWWDNQPLREKTTEDTYAGQCWGGADTPDEPARAEEGPDEPPTCPECHVCDVLNTGTKHLRGCSHAEEGGES